MANERRRGTRVSYLSKARGLETNIEIPLDQHYRALDIKSEAHAKAMSGDLTSTEILAASYDEGWPREYFSEQLDKKRPQAGAEAPATAKHDVQMLVFRQHIATAASAHDAIVAFRNRSQPEADPEVVHPTVVPTIPDLSSVISDISERVAEKVMAGLSVRPTTPPAQGRRVRKARQPAPKVSFHGVEVPERQKAMAEGIIQLAKSLFGDVETADRVTLDKGPSWMPVLFKAQVKADRMAFEKANPQAAARGVQIREGGAHLEGLRELQVITGEPAALIDVATIAQSLHNHVINTLDNGATEPEILAYLRSELGVSEENEGWPRFLIKSAGLTLVAGVYSVQMAGSVH